MADARDVNDRLLDGTLPDDPGDETESMPVASQARPSMLRLVEATTPPAQLALPHDLVAEASILSALLWAGTNAPTTLSPAGVRDLLAKSEMFFSKPHATIFDAMITVHAAMAPTSVVAVHSELRKTQREREVGGIDYLEKLVADARPTSEQAIRQSASAVRDAWMRRQVIKVAGALDRAARTGEYQAGALLEHGHAAISDLGADMQTASSFVSFATCAADVIRNAGAGTPLAMSTGLVSLDDVMGGFFPQEVTILAARTSVGKSALATQLAFAAVDKRPNEAVLYVSLEMPARSFTARVLSGRAHVSLKRLRRQTATLDDLARLKTATAEMKDWRVFFVDSQIQTLMSINTVAKRLGQTLAREGARISMIVIDHIGLIKPSADAAKKQREQQIAEASRGLKFLSQEHHCHVMGLAQISRESEKQAEKDKMPRLHHIRESGAIEQDAENVLILHRDRDRYGRFPSDKPARLAVAKARNDALGLVWLAFDGDTGRFSPWETSEQSKARAPKDEAPEDDEPEFTRGL